jgi:hypothetical protein
MLVLIALIIFFCTVKRPSEGHQEKNSARSSKGMISTMIEIGTNGNSWPWVRMVGPTILRLFFERMERMAVSQIRGRM